MLSGDPKFDELLREANERFNALSPLEQAAHRREQAISFVYGQLKLDGVEITKEEIARIYDESR
jgi:hypothetical protein